jgi:hypothetical protein
LLLNFAVVAPVNAQVNFVTEQPSRNGGFATSGTSTSPTFELSLLDQEVKVGLMLIVTITVYEHSVPAASGGISNSCSS